jgi:hypothetical protein
MLWSPGHQINEPQIDRNNIDIIETNDLQSSGLMSVLDATGLCEIDKIEMIQCKKFNNNI